MLHEVLNSRERDFCYVARPIPSTDVRQLGDVDAYDIPECAENISYRPLLWYKVCIQYFSSCGSACNRWRCSATGLMQHAGTCRHSPFVHSQQYDALAEQKQAFQRPLDTNVYISRFRFLLAPLRLP